LKLLPLREGEIREKFGRKGRGKKREGQRENHRASKKVIVNKSVAQSEKKEGAVGREAG